VAASRAALTTTQVQTLNTAVIAIGLLMAAQRQWLKVTSIQALPFWKFQSLNASQVVYLTTAQVAPIPEVTGTRPSVRRSARPY
jgi:hypothetical protein